jgi:organic radical activating enzyme
MDDIKTREFKESNYKAIFFNHKTLRFKPDQSRPMTALKYPEFYDVKITNTCEGKCPWCYQNSNPEDPHYDNILENVIEYFKPMTENERPFQVAIGGGEPTSHPDFIPLLILFKEFGIVPNYTTNGMLVNNDNRLHDVLRATKNYCGGVAVSTHPHLEKDWRKFVDILLMNDIKTNLHIIISDRESVDRFLKLYYEYKDLIEYFVLLPFTSMGRASELKPEVDFDYLFSKLKELPDISNVSYGANFYHELKKHPWLDVSLYEQEMFSKYLDLKDVKLYKSSFNLTQV